MAESLFGFLHHNLVFGQDKDLLGVARSAFEEATLASLDGSYDLASDQALDLAIHSANVLGFVLVDNLAKGNVAAVLVGTGTAAENHILGMEFSDEIGGRHGGCGRQMFVGGVKSVRLQLRCQRKV